MATAHLIRLRDSRATVLGTHHDDSETFAIEVLRTGELVIDGLTRDDARAKARSMNTGAELDELVIWRIDRRRPVDITERTDAELMRGTSNGCHESFEEIVRRYRRLVLYHANRMLRDEFAADDVSQEVLLTLLTKAGEFDPNRKSASAWIIGITRIRCLKVFDGYKRRKKLRVKLRREPKRRTATPPECMIDAEIAAENKNRIGAALATLPTKDATCLRLKFAEDMTLREIGAMFSLTKQRIAQIVDAARVQFVEKFVSMESAVRA